MDRYLEHAYFALQVSKKPKHVHFFKDDAPIAVGKAEGANLKCVMVFDTAQDEQILVKVGISGVSAEGAAGNIAAEVPAWDFEGVHKSAQDKWRGQIGKINAAFKDDDHKKIFYTALYHMSLGPTLYDDVDGRYRGMDNTVKTLPAGQRNYTTFSLWDTFRAAHPAYTLLEPERLPQFVNTLIRMGEESPAGAPVWPLHGRETECMTGYHCSSVIAEARNKGVTGPDYARAYEMLKRGRLDDVKGMEQHRNKGFIAADQNAPRHCSRLSVIPGIQVRATFSKSAGVRPSVIVDFMRSRYRSWSGVRSGRPRKARASIGVQSISKVIFIGRSPAAFAAV